VWNRPTFVPSNLPITKSATCKFKNELATTFEAQHIDGQQGSPEGIHYSQSNEDENEAGTVAFVDLDTKQPKVQSNGGQADLVRIGDAGEQLTLLNIGRDGSGTELYTIFRSTGVAIYSQQKNSVLVGPLGVLEMGYCN